MIQTRYPSGVSGGDESAGAAYNIMSKDPAFLLYYQDFWFGTKRFNNEQVGAYIRLLIEQADNYSLSVSDIQGVCSLELWDTLKHKFDKDSEGKFYNKRLRKEKQRREEYSKSRSVNRSKSKVKTKKHMKTYDKHMEDENENEIENRKESFKTLVFGFNKVYSGYVLNNFFDYWTEPNRSRSKMRFEMEKTWELSRRLKTWANRSRDFGKSVDAQKPIEPCPAVDHDADGTELRCRKIKGHTGPHDWHRANKDPAQIKDFNEIASKLTK